MNCDYISAKNIIYKLAVMKIKYVSNKWKCKNSARWFSTLTNSAVKNEVAVNNVTFKSDDFTNVTPKILSHLNKNLHIIEDHPLSLVRQRIVNYFYKTYVTKRGNPTFSVHDNISPVVSTEQNFTSLLIPENHPSRAKSDCYYINKNYLLRAHMTAHQSELIRAGLNAFLVIGDVYRRDEIDKTHYPVFHQVDGVYLRTRDDLFPNNNFLKIFEKQNDAANVGAGEKQSCHTLEAMKLMEFDLKLALENLAKTLFGEDIKYRWVETFFPFTQPSWELELFHSGHWMELLGCGIMKQSILANNGVGDRIGWAFGIGLERLAMCLYNIPDIRLFWSTDTGFLNQFKTNNVNQRIHYKPISQYPQCINDISFWLPENNYSSNDFYDLVRSFAGDIIEQVSLIDEFHHPKSGKVSHCYRIVYRHMERTLTQDEVNAIHKEIEKATCNQLKVIIR